MQTLQEGMARVGRVADAVGLRELAREAGIPLGTVKSFRARGWALKSATNCEKLMAAADRLLERNLANARKQA